MVIALFLFGLLMAAAGGLNSVTSQATWQALAVWALSAFGGAGVMVLAIYLRRAGL